MNRQGSVSVFIFTFQMRLVARATSALAIQLLSKRCHSTAQIANTISNDKGRLRLHEEKYCDDLSTPFKQPYRGILETLSKKTESEFRNSHMMVSQTQAKLLHQLVAILRPQRILEIGGFTGYSAIAMGSALMAKAKLLSLELDPKHIKIAEKYVNIAQLQDKIQFRQGPAIDRYYYMINFFLCKTFTD